MSRVFEVYMHRCKISGKAYVGITCRGVRNRLYSHESEARHGSQKPFHRAIRKYGIAAFETIILTNGLSQSEAMMAEQAAIAEHGTFGTGGYNATLGGEGTQGVAITPERREEISKQFRTMPRTQIHRQRIAEALNGKRKSVQHVERMKESRAGVPQPQSIAEKSRQNLQIAQNRWTGCHHSYQAKAAMRAAKSVELTITYPDGSQRHEVTTVSAIAESAGISKTAICNAMKAGRAIAKQGPLLGCRISKTGGSRNGG